MNEMTREILFRGKSESGKWIEGSLIIGRDIDTAQKIYFIAPLSAYYTEIKKVFPFTIGQYTGLTDKNGKKVFEGDIAKMFYKDGFEIGVIGWSNIDLRYKFASPDGTAYGFDVTDAFEVIGNIHDNPEFLKGGK